MTPALLPADPMLDVLTDVIASKRDTMAIMESALKQAREDVAHLRERRAVLLAKAAGFEVGQVWILDRYDHRNKPSVVVAIIADYSPEADSSDWRVELAYIRDQNSAHDELSLRAKEAGACLIGRVDSGPLVERLTKLLRKPDSAVKAA